MLCPKCGTSLESTKVTLCERCFAEIASSELENKTLLDEVEIHAEQLGHEPARFWLRLFAFAIDFLAVNFVCRLFGVLVSFTPFAESFLRFESLQLLFFGLPYIIAFESSKFRATPGKLVFGIYLVEGKDGVASFGLIVLRTLLKLVFPFGIFGALVRPEYQALYDKFCRIRVLAKENYPRQIRLVASVVVVALLLIWNVVLALGVKQHLFFYEYRAIDFYLNPPAPVVPKRPPPPAPKKKEPTALPPPKIIRPESFIQYQDTELAIYDKLALLLRQKSEIVVLYFDKRLASHFKELLSQEKDVFSEEVYERLGINKPVAALTLGFKDNAKTCNAFTYAGVYLSLFIDGEVKTGELAFSSWKTFEQETKLSCTHWKGTPLQGEIKRKMPVSLPGLGRIEVDMSLSLYGELK